ncbi:MAG: HAMP domain-containing protein, partial [bacterium]|nr:HAMP domain-containing protein [bacterium]
MSTEDRPEDRNEAAVEAGARRSIVKALGLRGKLVLASAAIGLIPLAVATTIAIQQVKVETEQMAGDFLLIQAAQTAEKLDRNLFERYGDVQAFASNPSALGSRDQIEKAANNYVRNYGIYDLMVVVDLDGSVVGTSTIDEDGRPIDSNVLRGSNFEGEDWFEAIRMGKIGHGESFYADLREEAPVAATRGGRGLSLVFAAPVYDEDDQVARIWINYASSARIVSEIMEGLRVQMNERGFTTVETQVLSESGQLIDDFDPEAIMTDFNLVSIGLESAKAVVSGESGYVREIHKRRQVEQVNGYAASKGALGFAGYGWGVLVRQDSEEAFAASRELTVSSLQVGAVAAVCILAAAWFGALAFVRIVDRLAGAVSSLESGDLDIDIPVRSNDELGALGEKLAG